MVRYWRAFKMSPRNRLQGCIDSLSPTTKSIHEHFLTMHHKLFAHHVGVGAACEVTVVSEVDYRGHARVTAVVCQQIRVSQLGADQAEQFEQLLDQLQPAVAREIECLQTALHREWASVERPMVARLRAFSFEQAREAIVRQVQPLASL